MLKGMAFRKGRHAFSHPGRRFPVSCSRRVARDSGVPEKVADRCKLLFAGVNAGLQEPRVNFYAICRDYGCF
jgi:hypothetical protein